MGATREGEKVDTFTSTQATRYGQLIQGVDDNNKAKFQSLDNEGNIKLSVAGSSMTETNPVPSYLPGHDCTKNSSQTPLGINGVFTGTWEDTLNYNNIIIGISSDQDSAVDGCMIQWSHSAIDDYTTGTVSIEAVTGIVTGVGTSFNAEMVGARLMVDGLTTIFRVSTFSSPTQITIVDNSDGSYSGGTVVAGTSFILSYVDDDDTFTILANKGKVFTFCPARRYFRIIYINDGVAQTKFSLQTVMKQAGIKPSSHRINDNIVAEDDAELVKATLSGEDDNGVFQNVKTDFGRLLRVNSFPYTYSIAEGDILGHKSLLKFGTRTSTSTVESTIWEGTAVRYPYIPTATRLSVVSTDSQDSSTGTGIRTLTLHGLIDNAGSWDEHTETITLTGTTPVLTDASFIRIFRAYGATSGTAEANIGTINVTASGVQVLVINPGDGQTLMALWTVPSGKTAYITNGSFSTNSNKGSIVSLYVRQNDGISYPWRIQYRAYIFSGNENFPFTIPFKIPEKTDLEVRTKQASVGADCGATFELWYED